MKTENYNSSLSQTGPAAPAQNSNLDPEGPKTFITLSKQEREEARKAAHTEVEMLLSMATDHQARGALAYIIGYLESADGHAALYTPAFLLAKISNYLAR